MLLKIKHVMKETDLIIKSKAIYSWGLPIGGLIFMIIGIYQLVTPFEMDKGGLPNWMLAIFFLPLGILTIFSSLDFRYLIIRKKELEIKSFFRKRIIRKEEITGVAVEKYEGDMVSGERIRIFTKKNSYKFHTSQFKSIAEIKQFVQKKPFQKNGFRREQILNIIGFVFTFAMIASPVIYKKYTAPKEEIVPVDGIGIPVKMDIDLKILEESEAELKFELKAYKGFIFTVNKKHIPKNMVTIDKELIVFIMNSEQVEALSNKQNPKNILVDGIEILE